MAGLDGIPRLSDGGRGAALTAPPPIAASAIGGSNETDESV